MLVCALTTFERKSTWQPSQLPAPTRLIHLRDGKEIFDATVSNLPNLKLILTLGEHSFNFIQFCYGNQISSDWHQSVGKRKVSRVQIGSNNLYIGSIYHTSNRGMIARARREGISGKNSCASGIELTKNDVKEIFTKLELLKGN